MEIAFTVNVIKHLQSITVSMNDIEILLINKERTMKKKKQFENGLSKESFRQCEVILDLGGFQITLEADILDITDERAVFITYYPIEPGQIVELSNGRRYGSGVVKQNVRNGDNTFKIVMNFLKEEVLLCNVLT